MCDVKNWPRWSHGALIPVKFFLRLTCKRGLRLPAGEKYAGSKRNHCVRVQVLAAAGCLCSAVGPCSASVLAAPRRYGQSVRRVQSDKSRLRRGPHGKEQRFTFFRLRPGRGSGTLLRAADRPRRYSNITGKVSCCLERSRDLGQRRLLSLADRHAAGAKESTFVSCFGHVLADLLQPPFIGRRITGRLGIDDCCGFPAIPRCICS